MFDVLLPLPSMIASFHERHGCHGRNKHGRRTRRYPFKGILGKQRTNTAGKGGERQLLIKFNDTGGVV